MSDSNRSAGDLREIALGILEHAKNSPEYLEKLQDNPEEALAGEGLTSNEAHQLIGEFSLNEVQGYLNGGCQFTCDFSCNTGTCQYTYCANFPATGGPMETRLVE